MAKAEFIKSILKRNLLILSGWTRYRSWGLQRDYEKRREHYNKLAQAKGLFYRESEIFASIQARVRGRGYAPVRRQMGEVHTFAFIPIYSWHRHLLPDLQELGPVTLFDYVSLGYAPEEFISPTDWDAPRITRRQEMLSHVLPAFREAQRRRPVDWVFCYAGGQSLSADVIQQITQEFGVPTVNMTFDDKQGWTGPRVGEICSGSRDLTEAFDLFFTSARVACEWHLVEGGRPMYVPEGFDHNAFKPNSTQKDIHVSFVGVAYGFRQSVVRYLQRRGVGVEAFGKGWPNGHVADMADIFNRSRINLGMGGIGYSESLTNVKGRDFEIPGTGGGVYLTSFNPDLAQHFVIGKEILCYRNREDMLELIRYYLDHPQQAREIARRGRERCLREHRWLHRYQKALSTLQILSS